jgi:hypothetical protein
LMLTSAAATPGIAILSMPPTWYTTFIGNCIVPVANFVNMATSGQTGSCRYAYRAWRPSISKARTTCRKFVKIRCFNERMA